MNGFSEQQSTLDQLDKLPKIKQFDAFPKTQAAYVKTSGKGGLLTLLVAFTLLILAFGEAKDYLYGQHKYTFDVDHHIGQEMQINVDMTVAMKCHYLTVDIRDAVGDRLHISDTHFIKDGTTFEIGHAGRLDSIPERTISAKRIIDDAKKRARTSYGKDNRPAASKKFKKTAHIVPDGPACRIYGSIPAKKVTGNLHITTLGHGYWSWEHTDHKLMNLSHVIHELSFGPYFPAIAQPLDSSVEISHEHFAVFQYFVSIVPTTYIDRWNRKLHTNQYSVSDYARTVQHGQGVPGIFVKYEVEPLTMTIRTRTTTFIQFLVRLAGILGGVWVCAGFGYRIGDRMVKVAGKLRGAEEPSYEKYSSSYSSSYQPTSGYGLSPTHRTPAIPNWMNANGISNVVNGVGWKASHRPTASVNQKIFSEEGRAAW